jgi:small-conductance mechanosensitive channel
LAYAGKGFHKKLASNVEPAKKGLSRRMMTLIYGGVVAAVIVALLYLERIDVLYILATLGLVALLLTVAFANLEGNTTEIES